MPNYKWCDFADLRRQQIEARIDITFVDVFQPMFRSWITELSPKRVIEIGAGTGHLSKALTGGPFTITAIEPSPGMHAIATNVLSGENVELIHCSSFELPTLPKFDLAFSHLVAHVVDDLNAFLVSVAAHLEQLGHFLFSIPHPCFYNSYKRFFGNEYNYMSELSKMVSFTITKDPNNIISGVPYHHRPISAYINSIVEAGFVVNGFHEIFPPHEIQVKYGKPWEVPRYCVYICKKL